MFGFGMEGQTDEFYTFTNNSDADVALTAEKTDLPIGEWQVPFFGKLWMKLSLASASPNAIPSEKVFYERLGVTSVFHLWLLIIIMR